MLDVLNSYCALIIEPIERELKRQQKLVLKKGIFVTKADKEYLVKLETLWLEKLRKLEEMMSDI